ncbi:AAA family ATPase [Legionella cherrii]|uniref:Shikimate kinase n=1 Tax=Legionella cherrii TaxID=28084 RepID=A0A0W0SGS6_9GAMM|nr:AAA family ATPase [Legionella cherrii]KTC82615.1 hypothetical protein Lche_0295 [Legionella cherrii]VEB35260.1 Uncharacterised protein [Legionella cherrii]
MTRIYIFGPSCSGKSTLSIELKNIFGDECEYIDRDDLIEQKICPEEMADLTVDEIVKDIEKTVIVDSQIPWREKKDGELFFLLFPPLQILLARNEKRNENLNRARSRSEICKQFVIETYEALDKISKEQFDAVFDSSYVTIYEIADEIVQIIQNKKRISNII